MHVRPLTRCGKDGHVLIRPPEVEEQIVATLALDRHELRRRVAVTDRDHADYLKDETLVYLLRESYRAEDHETGDIVAGALSGRCVPYARKHFRSFGDEDFDDAYADLLSKVLEMILDLETDRGDFLQVRFGRRLRFLALDIFDRYAPRINEARKQRSWPSTDVYDGSEDGEDRGEPMPAELRTRDDSNDRRLLGDEALRQLTEKQRTAFILKYYDGWPIESKEPGVPSISGYFDVTPKTVNNWLRAAEKALETWRGQSS